MTYISTKDMSRAEWLERRKHSIGGSDAGAILGLSKYSSAMSVWGEKTGRIPPQEDNEAMREGRDLEQYVADRFCEKTGKRVRRCNKMLYNPQYPYSHADIDREVIGENAGLECKTMSAPFAENDLENGNYPASYHAQCLHYMAITGADRWYLAILLFGHGLYVFTIERTDDVSKTIDGIMQAEREFWEDHVLEDIPPDPDGTNATTEALKAMFPDDTGFDAELDDEPISRYEEFRKQAEQLQQQMEAAKQEIMLVMQDSESGVSDSYRVTWKKRKRTTYNIKELMRQHPEIDMKPFTNTTEYRAFSVK